MLTTTHDILGLVEVDRFIQATRDSGYKGTASALAELIDNSLQAGARDIQIFITDADDAQHPLQVMVMDDGEGMNPQTLRTALRFGGSTRFGGRGGMGRYGMGLPNSSMSQARRVEVYTWQRPEEIFSCYLDLDEIVEGSLAGVPPARPDALPPRSPTSTSRSGTMVRWVRCDRLDNRRASTLKRKLEASVGRLFRHYLWGGVRISINNDPVRPYDPLFLHEDSLFSGARPFGAPLEYEVEAPPDAAQRGVGIVRVVFSVLPIERWHALSNQEKEERGISKRAGVSIVREGREIDYGWFFMEGKRKENYDDWWRCEVSFSPILDEAFGITHTKQQIRPSDYLREILGPDLAEIARALNAQVRRAHNDLRMREHFSDAERLASERSARLPALPAASSGAPPSPLLDSLSRRHPELTQLAGAPADAAPERPIEGEAGPGARLAASAAPARVQYKIYPGELNQSVFFDFARSGELLAMVVNESHPFYKKVYKRLLESQDQGEQALRAQLDLLLLSATRAEAALGGGEVARFREEWGKILATFLGA